MNQIVDRAFLLLQRLLPKHLVTSLVYRLTRIRVPKIKNFLIEQFIRLYRVNVDEIALEVPGAFADFNAFFTRELDRGARPVDASPMSVVSPVDGTVSASGAIDKDAIFQAKGLDYTLDDLLATDLESAGRFQNGHFATIYLAPFNYHRIHMPVAGKVVSAVYVPGDLFSVNKATVSLLGNLFARNERLVMMIDTDFGPMGLVMVGALNVGSISTPWSGEIRPQKSGVASVVDLDDAIAPTALDKGDLLGWFNMGSTVILLLPENSAQWLDDVESGRTVRMGEIIGTAVHSDSR